MKLPLDERTAIAGYLLTQYWPCEYWSRDEQAFAHAEGWSLNVLNDDRIRCYVPPESYAASWCEFKDNQDAVAYVLQRAQEGSPLHCRALVLHTANVLKNGI